MSQFKLTVPDDASDIPRFGQAVEAARDTIVLELRNFFRSSQWNRLGTAEWDSSEIPMIEKFAVADGSFDPYETVVSIVSEYPNIDEALPQIAVLVGNVSNKRMGIGGPHVEVVQDYPSITFPTSEPFALSNGDTLAFRTMLDGFNWTDSVVTFSSLTSANLATLTAAEAADIINSQSIYAHATASNGQVTLHLKSREYFPKATSIEILAAGSSAPVLAAFGLAGGEADDIYNVNNLPKFRTHQALEVQINLDLLAESPTLRLELADLLMSWVSHWLEKQFFTFMTWDTPNESYQMILHQEVSLGSQSSIPRPPSNKSKLHVQRLSFTLSVFGYLDRPTTNGVWVGSDLVSESNLPMSN